MTRRPIPKLSLSSLRPSPENPRKISEHAAEGLASSLHEFGDISGIVWNRRTGVLVAGHQRVEQLRRQGATMQDGALVLPSGERFPIRVVDWDRQKERAANLSANNPWIAGEFVHDDLIEMLRACETSGAAEFSALNLDELLADVTKSSPPPPAFDTSPQLGDELEFRVVVDCKSEDEQAALIERLEKEGFACHALMS